MKRLIGDFSLPAWTWAMFCFANISFLTHVIFSFRLPLSHPSEIETVIILLTLLLYPLFPLMSFAWDSPGIYCVFAVVASGLIGMFWGHLNLLRAKIKTTDGKREVLCTSISIARTLWSYCAAPFKLPEVE